MMNELLDIKVSHSGRYMLGNNMMYDVLLDESVSADSLHPLFWLNFLKENSEISYKLNRYTEFDIQTLLRKTAYVLAETFDENEKMNTLMEYERKYGSALLLESSNKYRFEKTLSEGWKFLIESVLKNTYGLVAEGYWDDFTDWAGKKASAVGDWVSDKAKKVQKAYQEGGITNVIGKTYDYAANKVSQAWDWVKKKGISFFMEGLRDAVLSPVGMAVEIFLTTTGVGAPVVMIIYGVLLIYDIYLWFSGSSSFDWINILFDLLGIFTSGVAVTPLKMAVKEAGIVGKSFEEGVGMAVKKGGKLGKFLRDIMTYVSKGLGSILSWTKKGTSWLAKNFGIKFLDNWVGKAQGAIERFVGNMEKAGVKTAEKTVGKEATTVGKEATTVGKEATTVGKETTDVVKKPGIISKVMEPLNKVGRGIDKSIETVLPGTEKRFQKDVFGNVIKNPAKISTGLRHAGIAGGVGEYLHSSAEQKKKESEDEMVDSIKKMTEKLKTDDSLTIDDVL